MDDSKIESILEKLGNGIPINQNLKEELRQNFKPRRRYGMLKRLAAIAAAAVIICTGVFFSNDRFVKEVSAASLNITNYISLVDLGGGHNLGVAEHSGTIYTPVAGDGVYVYDKTGYRRIYKRDVNFLSISRDGKKLAMSDGGTLLVYDIKSGSAFELLKPDDGAAYYEQPSWSEDGSKIIFTKKVLEFKDTHGFEEKESGIYEIQLDTKSISKITDGEYPSYIKGKDSIILERDGKVIIRSLKDGSENIIDAGRFPSVSPDGNYAAYVKTEETIKDADSGKNAKIQETIANIWIADASGSGVKKQVTNNFPQKSIDIEEWLRELEPSDIPQVLYVPGEYSYYHPVWSSDSKSIYAVKNADKSMRLIRIGFAQQKLSPEEIVKSFIQALIVRDEDYAKSIMASPPELLTLSNPRAVGLEIISRSKEGTRDYVDAVTYLQYTANPYYQAEKSRYYLSENETGYKIDEIKRLSSVEVLAKDDGAIYYSATEGDGSSPSARPEEKVLIKPGDIPQQYLPQGGYRVVSLYYNDKKGSLVFAVQGLEGDASLKVLTYNRDSGKFKLIDSIDKGSGYFLTADYSFKYAALDYFYDNDYEKPRTRVCSLDGKPAVSLYELLNDDEIDSVKSSYWDDDKLILETAKDGQAVKFIYNPYKKDMERFQ